MQEPRSSLVGALSFLTGARLVINTAHRFVYPFLPTIARGLGVSLDTAGFLVSARWGVGLATPALVGAIGRGERRRRLIAAGLALFAVGAAVTAATNAFVGALAGFLLMGLAKPMFDISAQAYLADRVPYGSRARYLAVLELTWAGGLLVGAPLAGWLIDRAGWRTPFWVAAALLAVSLWLHATLLEPDGEEHRERSAQPLSLDRAAAMLLVVIALFNAASEMMFVVFGAWLEDAFALSLVALGGTAFLIGAVELAAESSTVAFTDRIGKHRAVTVGLVVATAGYGLFALFSGSYALGVAALLIGIGGFEFTIVSCIPLVTEVRPYGRARFLAWMIVATSLGRGVGAAIGAPLFGWLGIEVNALVAAGANALAAAILVGFVHEAHVTGARGGSDRLS